MNLLRYSLYSLPNSLLERCISGLIALLEVSIVKNKLGLIFNKDENNLNRPPAIKILNFTTVYDY